MPLASTSRAVRKLLAGVASPLAALGLFAPTDVLAQQPFDVSLRDGLLSIRANDASVSELATALADETGINFVVTGDAASTITTEIVDVPFVKAVEQLSPNYLLMREGKNPDSAVIEVVLILDDDDANSGGGDGFLPSGAPADEIIGGEQDFPSDELPTEEIPSIDANQQVGADGNFVDGQDGIDPESLDQGVYQEPQ